MTLVEPSLTPLQTTGGVLYYVHQTNKMIDDLSGIIERLDKAIKICYEAEQMPGHDGYAYAAGYSRAIMMDTIEEIKVLIHTQAK